MLSLNAVVMVLLYILVAGAIFWLLWWGLDRINPPQPWRKAAEIVLIVATVLVLIGILLSLVSGQPLFRP